MKRGTETRNAGTPGEEVIAKPRSRAGRDRALGGEPEITPLRVLVTGCGRARLGLQLQANLDDDVLAHDGVEV